MLLRVELLLPFACAWARHQESVILRTGVPLSDRERTVAQRMGISHWDRVRLLAVDRVPPLNRWLRQIGLQIGVVSPDTAGMTLRYGIFIRADCWGDWRLVIHELAHVVQYERLGGFRAFLRDYLGECVNPGYPLGPLEREAKQAERTFQ
ncbi:MAG TPA: hypothetical protein VN673_13675 [Clostridia bacterium]|nr:hypothetical protein [Clostridia bacterium]